MGDRKMMVFFVSVAVTAASSSVTAQEYRSEPSQRDGACFYEDADYSGDYFCLRAGEQADSLPPGTNDRISSIFTFGRAEVTVYRDSRFAGPSKRFDYDVENLQDWNDRISSIRVKRPRGGFGNSGSSGGYRDPDRIIRRAYQDLLGREPDTEGLRNYRSR